MNDNGQQVGLGVRGALYLELYLVDHIRKVVDGLLLDSPTVNLGQPEQVPFDFEARAKTTKLKRKPHVVRGIVPRTVTGEIDVDKISDVPAIIVQAISGVIHKTPDAAATDNISQTTARIIFCTYDEDPQGLGLQDLLNLVHMVGYELGAAGQDAIQWAFPIVMPITWKIEDANYSALRSYPHYVAEMMTTWEMPNAYPRIGPDGVPVIYRYEHKYL